TRFDAVYSTSGATIDLTHDFAGTGSADPTAACSDTSLPGVAANYYFRVFTGMTLPAGTCFYPSNVSSTVAAAQRHWQTVRTGCAVGTTNGCLTTIGSTANTYTLPDNTAVAIRYFPATFYLSATTALPAGYGYTGSTISGAAPDGSALKGYQIKA